jgi:hypothetical protein
MNSNLDIAVENINTSFSLQIDLKKHMVMKKVDPRTHSKSNYNLQTFSITSSKSKFDRFISGGKKTFYRW